MSGSRELTSQSQAGSQRSDTDTRCYCGGPEGHQWAPTSRCVPPSSPVALAASSPASLSLFSDFVLQSDQSDDTNVTKSTDTDSSWGNSRLPPSLVEEIDGVTTERASSTSSICDGNCPTARRLREEIVVLKLQISQFHHTQDCKSDRIGEVLLTGCGFSTNTHLFCLNSPHLRQYSLEKGENIKMAINLDLINEIKFKQKTQTEIAKWLCEIHPTSCKASEAAYRKCVKKCQDTYRKLEKSKKSPKGKEAFDIFLRSELPFPQTRPVEPNPKQGELPCTSTNHECSYRTVSFDLALETKKLTENNQKLIQTVTELRKSKIPKKTVLKLKSTIKAQTMENKILQNRLKHKDQLLRRIRLQNTRHLKRIEKLNNTISQMSEQIKDLRTDIERQELENEFELETSRNNLSDTIEERDWLADIVNESDKVTFYDNIDGKYSYKLRECIYTLLSLNISAQNVTPAIQSVLKLIGKKCEKLPARSTILNMNVERLVISQKQLSEVIPDKTNLTLYTDETSKFGVKYSGYHVSDEEGTMYVLGVRQLETKSAQHTLNVFENILADIEEKSEEANHTAKNILLKITATMSDRASTEKKFNRLLEELRSEVLPELVGHWSELSKAEQTSISTLLNFFCGLHSLVHFAETCNASLTELEKANFNNEAPIFDKSVFKKTESGAARLIRTACKALSRGADEKSGKFNDFNLYVKQVLKDNGMKSIPLEEFHGNRFNILFESATGVFFLKDQIHEFLNGNQTNKLLKAVLHDIKVPWYLSEVKALGLISRLITVPLWCLLEDKTIHILDMNKHYLELVNFFDEALNDINSFMKGKILPFGEKTVVKQDPLLESLLADWVYDDKVVVSLNIMLPALSQLCKRIFSEHLPGGCWENVTDEMRQKTSGTAKHNKFAESVFGYLDNLLRMKPNISALASEAFVMFSANKTKQWLERKNESEKNKLIQEAMKDVTLVRENYKRRKEEIEANQRRKVEESIREAEAAEGRRLNRLEGYSQKMIYYGLWQTENEVDSALKEFSTKKETMEALKAQLNFRKHVLKQDPKNKENSYLLSTKENGVKRSLTIDEITCNVKKLVRHAFSIDTSHDPNPDMPILTSKTISHRLIQDGESHWWKGKVISQVPGYPDYFNIVYEGDISVYVYRLLDDYKAGDVRVLV